MCACVCVHPHAQVCTQGKGETRRHHNDQILITPESSMLSLRCLLMSCEHLRLGMQAGKCGPQASQGDTVLRVGKVSFLQAASPLKPEAGMRQFSVNGMKAIACFMARKSSVPPFGSPPHPLHTSLILIGGKEISAHFVALFPITRLPVFPSVLSLTLIPLPAPKGCWCYSLLLSEASFLSLLLRWSPLTSTLCPQPPLAPL